MTPVQLFHLGRIQMTPRAGELLARFDIEPVVLLGRHITGDWGDLDEHDQNVNTLALAHGSRLMSWYQLDGSVQRNPMGGVWIMTEADRQTTTILTPEDY